MSNSGDQSQENADDRRTALEEETKRLHRELEQMMTDLFAGIEKCKETIPIELLKMACRAVLGRDVEEQNIFLNFLRKDNYLVSSRRMYGDFADLILKSLPVDEEEGAIERESNNGVVSFLEIIGKNLNISDSRIRYHLDLSWPSGTGDVGVKCSSVIHRFFELFDYDLAIAIDFACRLVYEGVPVYVNSGDDDEYDLLDDEKLIAFIEKKGEFFESGKTTDIPSWTKNLFFKESDLQVHSVFFTVTGDLSLPSESIKIKRKALRDAIGIPERHADGKASASHEEYRGELLALAHRVQDRFWNPDRFDASDRDSYPQQTEIIDWIKGERSGISDAEAKAVEKVACPIKR